MPRSDRLFRLLQAMRVMPAPITARSLAHETDVSLRTLYRDIDSLRAAGARIEGERGYGYQLSEDYALPPQMLDRDEIEALALGLAHVRTMGDATLARSAASVLAKVAATLPDGREQQVFHAVSQVYRPESPIATAVNMDTIRNACWKERALRISYRDKNDALSQRTIYPLAVMYTDQALTILAWCCMREDFRMFRGDRIKAVEDAEISFRPRRAVMLRDYIATLQSARVRQ